MIRFTKIILTITVALQLCWLLPWVYGFLCPDSTYVPFTLYSSELGDFISTKYDEDRGVLHVTPSGQEFTEEESDSLLPFFYARQLMADERFPEQVCGHEVTPRQVQMTNIIYRMNASDLNKPKIGLYPLLESLSRRVDLEMSDDVFRITNEGIEFIVMETNSLDEAKSERFTRALQKKGFSFPATYIAGNPNTRKDYDEGYLILDAEGKLFHMKQQCGRPYVRAIELPEGLQLKHLFVTEFNDRSLLGLLTDVNNKLYVLRAEEYTVMPTEVPSYNPNTDDLMIIGNMLDWTVAVATKEAEHFYALDATDYRLIKQHDFPISGGAPSILSFTSFNDAYVYPRFFAK